VHDAIRSALGIDPALIRDDASAPAQAAGQHGFHAIVEIGVIAWKRWIPTRPHLGRGDSGLGHGLEAKVVEIAPLGIERGRLNPVSPPGGPRPDAQNLAHRYNSPNFPNLTDSVRSGPPLGPDCRRRF